MIWPALEARIQKVQNDCTNPSSSLYKSGGSNEDPLLTRIDQDIQSIVQSELALNSDWAASLQNEWNRFKAKVPHLIKVDQAIRAPDSIEGSCFIDELEKLGIESNAPEALTQDLKALKEAGVSQASIQQVQRVAACYLGLLKIPIKQAKAATQASSTQSVSVAEPMGIEEENPENLLLSNALLESVDTDALDQENRLKEEMGLLPENRPHIAQAIRSLLVGLTAGKYGENIIEAFRGSDPSVISQEALLKFLLIEHVEGPLIPHTLSELELEIPGGSKAAIEDLRTAMKTISPQEKIDLLEKIFLSNGNPAFSEKEKEMANLLNNAVKDIDIIRMDAQIFPRLIYQGLDAFDQYEQAFKDVANIEDPAEQFTVLLGTIKRLGSRHPLQFFKAIDKALESIDQLEPLQWKEGVLDLTLRLYIGLETDLDLAMIDLPEESEVLSIAGDWQAHKMNEVKWLARLSTLRIPMLLSSDRRSAMKLIKRIVLYAESHKDFVLPTALFQLFIEDSQNIDSTLLLQIAKLVPLRARAQCLIQLMEAFKGKVDPTQISTWKRESLKQAQEFIKSRLCDYLENRNTGHAERIKTNIRPLLVYLSSELGKDLETLEFDLLTRCIDQEKDPTTMLRLRILLIPELVRIGRKVKAIGYAKQALEKINQGIGNESDKDLLSNSLLKAAGVKSETLDCETFGTLSEPSQTELDSDLTGTFFDIMRRVYSTDICVDEMIWLFERIRGFYIQSGKESYKTFANKIAQEAIEGIKKLADKEEGSLQGKIESTQNNLALAGEFLDKISEWIDPEIAKVATDHIAKMDSVLFNLQKQELDEDPSMDLLTRIEGYLELFPNAIYMGRGSKMPEIGNKILDLMQSVDEGNRSRFGVRLKSTVLVNLEAISGWKAEGAGQIEEEMKTLFLNILCGNIPDLTQYCEYFKATDMDFSLKLGLLAFEEIQKIGGHSEQKSFEDINSQEEYLIKFMLVSKDLGIFPQVKEAFEKMEKNLRERLPSLVEFREQLVVCILLLRGYLALNQFGQAIQIIKDALETVRSQNGVSELALSRLKRQIIAAILHRISQQGVADVSSPDVIKTELIDLFFQLIECTNDPLVCINQLINLHEYLKGVGLSRETPLYEEMSLIAARKAIQKIQEVSSKTEQKSFLVRMLQRWASDPITGEIVKSLEAVDLDLIVEGLQAVSNPAEKMKRCLEFLYGQESSLDQKIKVKEIFIETFRSNTFDPAIAWIEDPLAPTDSIKRCLFLLREELVPFDQKTRIKGILDTRINSVMDYGERQELSEEIKLYFPDLKRRESGDVSSSSNKKPKKL